MLFSQKYFLCNPQSFSIMPETTPDKVVDAATHVEVSAKTKSAVTEPSLKDLAITLDSDDLRDQMAAQVKVTRLKFTSSASLQMFFFLFVAHCSKHPSVTTCLFPKKS
jgi:hypothetical protein